LDAEDSAAETRDPADNVADIRAAIAYADTAAGDIPLGIYTGCWWWQPYTADYAGRDVCYLPVWIANYRDPDYNGDPPHVCGGWTQDQLYMWQYAGSVYIGDINVDRNIILETDMPDTYTRAEVDAKIGAVFGLGLRNQDSIFALAKALADHVQNHGQTAIGASVADLQALKDKLEAEQAELDARIRRAAEILGTPIT
jgi:hypothetical protein